MAITNYTDLQSTIADYLARTDLTTQIPTFIQLTEAKLQRKFKDVTSLSSIVSTNWLLSAHPDVYLYGALLEAQPYLQDDARIATWAQIFDKIVAEVRRPNTSSNFTNYTGLQYMISDYLNRPDLDNIIPTFIALGEARLRRDLRIRPMLKVVTTTTTASDATVALPTDFLEMRDIHIESTPIQTIVYQNPSNFYRNTRATESGLPKFYTAMGSEFQFSPIPDSAYTLKMVYYAAPTQLSSSNSSNVFLANCQDLLLYASLGEAEPYLMNDARIQTWASLYDRGLASLTVSDDAGESPSAPMVISLATR